jgi:1-acyl-sn-glycerol-3-phosphate acyltransferase
VFRLVTDGIFRVHAEQLERVPATGPLILTMNHVNLLELPLIYARLQPRQVHGLVLAERWKNPVLAWGLDACDCIPLERGGVNRAAFGKALHVLSAGEIVIIMPEGTRSYTGQLQHAHAGVVILALKSGAPVLPILTHGGARYRQNLRRLRRTDFHITVGRPFTLKAGGGTVDGPARKEMLDELMYQMAALLPPECRGAYASLPAGAPRHLEFC